MLRKNIGDRKTIKKTLLLAAALNGIIILSECNNDSDKSGNTTTGQSEVKKQETANPATLCFELQNEKDTVLLKMTTDENKVSGSLIYHYFEKDRNTGTINGEMKGDTLFATYSFMSEGKESKRDIVFLKKGDELIEGYGNINPTTGNPDFTNHSAIKFDEKFALKKSDCK